VFERIGFLDKMEDAGFVHKPGAAWNSPRSPLWRFIEIPLFEYPIPGGPRPYTFNLERNVLDTMLLRHAHENGAKVLQGVRVDRVLFEDGRATGVRASAGDGWERDLRAKVVVDASGRRCFLATQLEMKRRDPNFNQFCVYSWFDGVVTPPEKFRGWSLFYFLGLDKGWAWHLPLRNGVTSMGVVVDKADFQKSGKETEDFFYSLVKRNRTFTHVMKGAERIRPWWIEGDYSYKIDRFAGPGWLLIGDALRFVDPIFSSGVDVALFSALYAYEALMEAWRTGDEAAPFDRYQHRVTDGVDIWYDLIDTFYKLQNLVSRYATRPGWREMLVRTLQGNPYIPETQERARTLLTAMHESYETVMADPSNLLRPWVFDDMLREHAEWHSGDEDGRQFPPCTSCGGRVRFDRQKDLLVCTACQAELPLLGSRRPSERRVG
jgi:FADH2 O2-dependent halogenase